MTLVIVCLAIWLFIRLCSSNKKPVSISGIENSQSKISSSNYNLNWSGHGELIEIQGYKINEPLVYWAKDLRAAEQEASCILTSASVKTNKYGQLPPLGYWPCYSSATAEQRAYYLNWLATGKQASLEEIGYAFIYFYGLEFRALVEKQDISLIINESLRLLRTYSTSNSFNMYLSNFIIYLVSRERVLGNQIDATSILEQLPVTQNELSLELKIIASLNDNNILSPELAYEVAEIDPRTSNSIVVQRVNKQFKHLFYKKYQEKFGEGLTLSETEKRSYRYHPSSKTLLQRTHMWETLSVPHILGRRKQFTPLVNIWNECIEELRSLSKIAQKGTNLNSREAFHALPEELKKEIDHPEKYLWEQLVANHIRDDGHVIVYLSEVAKLGGIKDNNKLTLKQSKDLAQLADDLGYYLVPDPRQTSKSYVSDSLVALVKQNTDNAETIFDLSTLSFKVEELIENSKNTRFKERYDSLPNNISILIAIKNDLVTRRDDLSLPQTEKSVLNKLVFAIDKKVKEKNNDYNYDLAVIMLELGMVIASADSIISESEVEHITRFLTSQFRLNNSELQKLVAYREILRMQPLQITNITKKLKAALTLEQIELLLNFAIGVAAADGVIDTSEIQALRKIYSTLGIDIEKLENSLRKIQSLDNEPIEIKQAKQRSTGEPIPNEDEIEQESKVKLNTEYLRQIINETSQVTAILANALREAGDVESISPPESLQDPNIRMNKGILSTLDYKYHEVFTELLAEDEWTSQEFQALAKKHGLMPGSICEVINSWSDEFLGDFLIEDGLSIKVNKKLVLESQQ